MAEDMVPVNGGGDLATLPDMSGANHASMDTFDQLVRGSFLPRVQLCGGSSDIVKEGKINVGRFAFVRGKDDFVDFGPEVNLIPLSWRFAAMRFGEKVKVVHDPESEEFKAIVADSGTPDSGCSYGPQFLVWVPQVKDFATYFFGSASARPEARKMQQLMNQAVTIKNKLVSNAKNKWHVPIVLRCSTQLELPPVNTATTTAQRFNALEDSHSSEPETPAEPAPVAAGGERVR